MMGTDCDFCGRLDDQRQVMISTITSSGLWYYVTLCYQN
jgi:hypothetical protein